MKNEGIELICINCKAIYEANPWLFRCPKCNGLLEVKLKFNKPFHNFSSENINVWKYYELLPNVKDPITLDEGGTPLIPSRLFENTYMKFEGSNPTGSFKDRGMTVAISIAKEANAKSVIVASTGNTAASASAYAARANLDCFILLPKGAVARGKLAQAALHGAKLYEIKGNFDLALSIAMRLSKERGLYPLNSFNPWRLEGQKTIAYEIFEQLGSLDYVIVPVGNAGNISAIWKGFKELHELKIIDRLPKMIGVQAIGSAPIAKAWLEKRNEPIFIENPSTIASAIRIGKPVNWPKAWKAVEESKGSFVIVSDEEILEAQRSLARIEGIGSEPAGAAGYAAMKKLVNENVIKNNEKVVIVVTGHALKDPENAIKDMNITEIKDDEIDIILRNES